MGDISSRIRVSNVPRVVMVRGCGQFRPVKPLLRKVLGRRRLCLKLPKKLRCDSGERQRHTRQQWPFLAALQQAAIASESCLGAT